MMRLTAEGLSFSVLPRIDRLSASPGAPLGNISPADAMAAPVEAVFVDLGRGVLTGAVEEASLVILMVVSLLHHTLLDLQALPQPRTEDFSVLWAPRNNGDGQTGGAGWHCIPARRNHLIDLMVGFEHVLAQPLDGERGLGLLVIEPYRHTPCLLDDNNALAVYYGETKDCAVLNANVFLFFGYQVFDTLFGRVYFSLGLAADVEGNRVHFHRLNDKILFFLFDDGGRTHIERKALVSADGRQSHRDAAVLFSQFQTTFDSSFQLRQRLLGISFIIRGAHCMDYFLAAKLPPCTSYHTVSGHELCIQGYYFVTLILKLRASSFKKCSCKTSFVFQVRIRSIYNCVHWVAAHVVFFELDEQSIRIFVRHGWWLNSLYTALLSVLFLRKWDFSVPSTLLSNVALDLETMDLNITLHGPSLNIVRRCGPALRGILRSKFGCEATIEGVDFESDASAGQLRRPPVDPVKKSSFLLGGGVELSVWKADLTNFKVDAVVNAANEFLKHGGGLAYALSIAGGSQIQKESDDYINKYGHVGTGEAIVLDAGRLPCKKIIHAVGPCLTKQPSSTEVSGVKWKLEMAIMSILHQVEKHRLQSVAIPAISSGLFNFPLPECADTIVETVTRYYQSSHSHVPKEIRLANHDDITVSAMERACIQLLSSSSSSSKGVTRSQTPEVQIGKVHLTLKKGKIEEQQTDVIVNTTSEDRDLKFGEISKALLQKAGYEMQKEISKVSFTGRLLITNSYNLKCKKVFHTVCLGKGSYRHNTTPHQVLGDSVTECLQNAAKDRYKSIAFPAIGTGNLGFDKKEVAWIMANAVDDFAHNCQTEIDVMFIIYPSDDQTYKVVYCKDAFTIAFEEHMVTLQQRAPRPQETGAMMSSPPEYEHRNDSHSNRAPTPQITLSGPSETIHEAQRWLSVHLHKSYGFNNFIQHFGEREHLQLSRLMEKGVVIEEIFKGGHARISVTGNSSKDAVVAGFHVEAMLCNVQEEFVRDEEDAMCEALGERRVDFERKKVDKVVNPSLKKISDLKATQLHCSTQKMFQLIPAQFCEMVCKIGFHAEYAPPGEAAYGEGIYFAGTVKKAMEVWKEQTEHSKEEYLYFVEAEVLTGNSTRGTPGLILPPPVFEDPLLLHDSVSGGPDVSSSLVDSSSSPSLCFTDSKSLCFHTSVHTHSHSHSVHSAISVPSTSSVWIMPSRLFPLLTAFTQQLWSPSVKCVSVPSSTNSPCRCEIRKESRQREKSFSSANPLTASMFMVALVSDLPTLNVSFPTSLNIQSRLSNS
ncbi:hypothetical protein F7725_001720 [Dissostichus mawsoni]|uniref:Macro domain-containing protein n=1 Tax=Dissostichus mawsoni TaxID=36200 RepID=A0A7J5Y1B6_DISMA|nr:hypothetical protein F7725_001720 [Dissostichus mawsoni]